MDGTERSALAMFGDLSRRVVPSPGRLMAYQRLLFRGVPLRGRSLLDVGGGSGLMSFFAAANGAAPVVCLEPGSEGSNSAMERQFAEFADGLGARVDVDLVRERFQNINPADQMFDVVLVHNAINHLDEAACAALPQEAAKERYREVFRSLARLMPAGGDLILADCGRRNFWGDAGLPNIFAPTITWGIHQEPGVWIGLAKEAGFAHPRVLWDAPSKIGQIGQTVLGNRVGSYLTNSHFVLHMRKDPSVLSDVRFS